MFKIIINNLHLEKIFWIIKTKIKYMILIGLICGIAVGGYTLMTKKNTYAAEISLYVYSNPDYINDSGINLSSGEISSASSLLTSYLHILQSQSFLQSVIDAADIGEQGYTPNKLVKSISAYAVQGTAVFNVVVYDRNPYNAMLIANTIGKLAPEKIISIVKSGGIEVLDEATLPTTPYQSTSILMMTLLGIIGGGGLSFMWFLLRGLMDSRIRRVYEVEDTFTIPILGKVPQIEEDKILLNKESPFVLKEAYNEIRANLLFLGKGEKCPVFTVTGADYDEGKTANSINVAKMFGTMGKKVLLIDADLRNGDIAEKLNLHEGKGLSEYLASIASLNIIKNCDENLDVLTSGAMPPNPTDLLISKRWLELIDDCKEKYDVIIIDTPSVGIVSDAIELAAVSTAYILILREFLTRLERAEMIVRNLEAVDANICGFIYNGISMKSEDYNHKAFVNGGDYGERNSSGVQHRKIYKKVSGGTDLSDT